MNCSRDPKEKEKECTLMIYFFKKAEMNRRSVFACVLGRCVCKWQDSAKSKGESAVSAGEMSQAASVSVDEGGW